MLHRVNKLCFEASCATEAQAFEVRNSFSASHQEEIAAVIDKVCSQYVSEDEWVQIDTIEVDLGNFNIQAFEKIFTQNFLAIFEKEFSKKMHGINPAEKVSSKQASYYKLLVYFLQTGTLPWWAGSEEININQVFKEVAEKQYTNLVFFLEQRRYVENVWKRIANQFDEEVFSHVFQFFPELAFAERKLSGWIELAGEDNEKVVMATSYDLKTSKKWKQFIIRHAPLVFGSTGEEGDIKSLIVQFAGEYNKSVMVPVTEEEIVLKISNYGAKQIKEEPSLPVSGKENEGEEKADLFVADELSLPEKFFVQYAGIILLAPILKQFFQNLKLQEDGDWKNPEAHYKAIHLVRYLASGERNCPEHSLVMEKLLCGMDITAPIPGEIELSEEEMSEAAALLQSVISNWEALKNTSVNGLRETFLKRDGILTKKEKGWLLQVERKTADVLLDRIPWGFTTIALPWNSYIIFTEW